MLSNLQSDYIQIKSLYDENIVKYSSQLRVGMVPTAAWRWQGQQMTTLGAHVGAVQFRGRKQSERLSPTSFIKGMAQ